MIKLRVFISSVQEELTDERRAVKTLIASDPFLDEHCIPILYEDEPSMLKPAPQGYLQVLDRCQVYLTMIGSEYGKRFKGLSATHHEYNFAREKRLPILACVRGDRNTKRDSAEADFLRDIREDGYKYHRFNDTRELQGIILKCLMQCIKRDYHVAPSLKDEKSSALTIDAASDFDRQPIVTKPGDNVPVLIGWDDIDLTIAYALAAKSADDVKIDFSDVDVREALLRRGLLRLSQDGRQVFCSAAGTLLLAKDPTIAYPQSCIRLLAFKDKDRDAKPRDFLDVSAPIPTAIEKALAFIDKNTRHPLRVMGIRRLRLNEYPSSALREALVNAMAHRNYEDAARRIHIELFSDRIVIISPGGLPGGISIEQLRAGKAHPCSRNPSLAQGLRLLGLMEEMGTGVLRMKQAMLDHGLDHPQYDVRDGCFVVTFSGPADDLDRILIPSDFGKGVPPSVEEQLNARQKKILEQAAKEGFVTTGWCRKNLAVVYDTIRRDILKLQSFGLIEIRGRGRSTRYVITGGAEG
jgi:ATP-dependent DNA helicase RecG